ncbi:Beta-lactamase enzyme family protein [Cryptosporangium aurantiacum]|uniref:Beta-lactamase enzyme family protein n=1 Tax=Cryptosporangium aurantiacum TaxID=134849 RepID=A0A1M7Q6W5_9ACTN|nr:Beta-lactamase enzyme family protein [Cryptosporangium aurantiacum]
MRRQHWRRWTAGALGIALLGATVTHAGGASAAEESVFGRSPAADAALATALRKAVDAQQFADVLDTVPPSTAAATQLYRTQVAPGDAAKIPAAPAIAAAAPIHQTPQLDATVIKLDRSGRPVAAADVLLSPQYPNGKIIPLDKNLTTTQVRWRQWDDATWDNNNAQGTIDIVPGRESAPVDFMSPYPASVLKLMVAFGILRMVDAGELSLDDTYTYTPVGTPSSLCGGARTATSITQLFDEMITVSSNPSTCALIKLMHERGKIDGLNQQFVDLGLPTLRLAGTNPNTGGTWANAVTMSSIDTAKLLLLFNGSPGVLWRTPSGTRVTASVLSASSRTYVLGKLGEQGLNQVLSTTNYCGREYPAQGIPQTTPARWINPADGTVTVGTRSYGQDVRPCNAAAQVTFAHKTGLADTSGNDAGIVKSLPGKPFESYIVSVHSNLGYRYIDPDRPADPAGTYPVQYTEKLALLGAAIHAL